MPVHPSPAAGDIANVLRTITADPSRPRITWYGEERIELSGATLGNWVAKTANLLVEEIELGPGDRLVLDLPVHWRSLVWALAAWRVGATVAVGEVAPCPAGPGGTGDTAATGEAAAIVTSRPEHWTGSSGQLIAVALPGLARRFDGALAPGTIDAAADVMTYPDELLGAPPSDPGADALVWPGGRLTFAELATRPAPAADRRFLVVASAPERDLVRALGIWRANGSVVLLDPGRAEARDADRRAALLAAERVDEDLS